MTINATAPSIRQIPFVETFDRPRQEALATRVKEKFSVTALLCVESPAGITVLPERFDAPLFAIATCFHALVAVDEFLKTGNKKALMLKPKADIVDPYGMILASPDVAQATRDPVVKAFFMRNKILPFIKVMSTELKDDETLLGLGIVSINPALPVDDGEIIAAFKTADAVLGRSAKALAA